MSRIRVFFSCVPALVLAASAQAQSFTYRGQLDDDGRPAEGRYALQLTLYASEHAKQPASGPLQVSDVQVAHGRFAVGVEFPDLPAYLDAAWLEVAVKPAEDDGAFIPFAGRAQIALKATEVCPASWTLSGNAATNPSVNFLGTTDAQAVEVRANNTRVWRSESLALPVTGFTANVVGGSPSNTIAPTVRGATIAGGGTPVGGDNYFVDAGPNTVTAHYGTVGGGWGNRAGGSSLLGPFATVAGGVANQALASSSTVAGGWRNGAYGGGAAIGGGAYNSALGAYSTIPGGLFNCAGGDESWAGGTGAKVRPGAATSVDGCDSVSPSGDADGDEGSFVWADASAGAFVSTGPNQFNIRAVGGMNLNPQTNVFFGAQTRQMLNLWGAVYAIGVQADTFYSRTDLDFIWYRDGEHSDTARAPGTGGAQLMLLDRNGTVFATGFVPSSDRALKSRIAEIEVADVLAQVISLPIREWSFSHAPAARHIGPMAQDFHAAFGLNGDDATRINTLDADGVALAAIQGLNAKLERENSELRARLDGQAEELAALRAQVVALAASPTEVRP